MCVCVFTKGVKKESRVEHERCGGPADQQEAWDNDQHSLYIQTMLYMPHIRRLKLGIFAGFNARNIESCNRPTIGIGRIGTAYEWVLARGTHTQFCQVSPKKVYTSLD